MITNHHMCIISHKLCACVLRVRLLYMCDVIKSCRIFRGFFPHFTHTMMIPLNIEIYFSYVLFGVVFLCNIFHIRNVFTEELCYMIVSCKLIIFLFTSFLLDFPYVSCSSIQLIEVGSQHVLLHDLHFEHFYIHM